MEPPGSLEWRLKAWARTWSLAQVARVLSYVPLLLTPALAAIALCLYRGHGRQVTPQDKAFDQTTMLIALLNIVLSGAVIWSASETAFAILGDLTLLLRFLFNAPREFGLTPLEV